MTDFTGQKPIDYEQEKAAGRIPGVSNLIIYMESDDLPTADFGEVWGGDTAFVWNYGLLAETWEAISTSIEDAPGQTGAEEIQITYIDDNFLEVTQSFAMNGTSVAPITGADKVFPNGACVTVITAGNKTAGDITIRVAGGGATRAVIKSGFNASRDAVRLVPIDETWYIADTHTNVGKGRDAAFIFETTTGNDGIWIERPDFEIYQAAQDTKLISEPIISLSFVRITGKSENSGTAGDASVAFTREKNT